MSLIGGKIRIIVTASLMLLALAVVPEAYSPCNVSAQTTKKATGTRRTKSNTNANSRSKSNSKVNSNSKSGGTVSNRGNRQRQNQRAAAPKTSAEAKKLQVATQKEIQQTKEKIRLNEQQVKTGLSELNLLSTEIASGRVKVDGLQKKVASLNSEISTVGKEIERNEAELKLMREEYLKAVRKMRLTSKNQSTLAFIFSSENFNQAMRRIRYMRQFSAWKEKKSSDIAETVALLESKREHLAQVKDQHSAALSQLNASQAELESKHKKQEKLVADLRSNGSALQSLLAAKQKEANRLKETISTLIAQEQAKAEAERKAREKAEAERKAAAEREAARKAAEKEMAEKANAGKSDAEKTIADRGGRKKQQSSAKENEKTAKSKQNEPSLPKSQPKKEAERIIDNHAEGVSFASLRGKLPRPVDGAWRITNAFGRHAMPELPEVVYDNPGIDAEVAIDTSVKSVCAGKVSGVYKVAGYGTVVIVNHGDYYTVYGNLSSANVTVGTPVSTGSKLGTAGHDPDDSRRGSVHFEVWKGREKQNPSSWLR